MRINDDYSEGIFPMGVNGLGSSDIKVSVAMITYNHEAFIAQAIESVLMQQTDFKLELIIGEDCSTDATREIVVEYFQKYPELIRLILHEHNVGAQTNSVGVLNSCRGQYIASLEGDDYWTDPLKLQKQVNFLDSHPNFVICFHNTLAFFQDNSQASYLFHKPNERKVSTIEDLLISNFIQTMSVLFKRGLIINFPEWYFKIKIGDWPLHIMNARFGKIGYLNDVMAHYRIHKHGLWSTMDRLSVYSSIVDMFHHLDRFLDSKYSPIIKSTISGYYVDIATLYMDRKDYKNARIFLTKSIGEFLSNFWKSRYFLVLIFRLYLPRLYHFIELALFK